MGALSPLDPSSYSRPEIAVIKHIHLVWDVDFDTKVLSGIAVLNFDLLQHTDEIVLDVNNLTIHSIELSDGLKLKYTVDKHVPNFGSRLAITLPHSHGPQEPVITKNVEIETAISTIFLDFEDDVYKPHAIDVCYENKRRMYKEDKVSNRVSKLERIDEEMESSRIAIKVKYQTAPSASALQWLEPNQTSGKKHPYMFSQCQPIHARSILPCQDTPAVKFTYDAEVSVPKNFKVLMSAIRGDSNNTMTKFYQNVPIPSYLLAIAVGALESKQLGPRSYVWSEKEEIERSAWEFADTEKYLKAAESLCGPYQWGQYDLLVLPPSFPYGGMENPCLTFVTPTLLAGDRSQADVIVHEIMHSWTGNLVTNKNFEHFWLNEGFTVFLERKVGASLIADPAEAKRSRDFHSLLGLQELTETINEEFGPTSPLTRLVPDLNGVHPDDAFSRVPYEKGSLFLRYLEDLVGGPEVFDEFLRSYLNYYQRRSLETKEFKEYLLDYFSGNNKLSNVDWDAWFFHNGMPPVIPNYDTSMTKAVTALATKITESGNISPDDIKGFTPHQIINLLQELVERNAMTVEKLHALNDAYKISDSKNSEIQYRWMRLCVRSKDSTKLDDVFNFLNNQGRMKFVRPIYRDLYAWEEVRQKAIDNFLQHEPYMMHVSAYTLRKDLHLSE
ncbi:Leukotriene A-4 hydrolase [Papilio machaon]|uniref:Leukotriene A-4 hydrolase n=1 Tax=Papilio machaon TaxID=76193 RepID=A0A0N1INX3_PAPMA|nr:Leukotriene A-4 hydrolase [Papilio machaon]